MNITFTTIYKKQKKHAYHIIAICLLAVGICFFSCSKESKLSGVVIDRDTKNGIKDIEVILISTDTTKVCTTYTGANGIYKFNPPPSNYKIIINRGGLRKMNTILTISSWYLCL